MQLISKPLLGQLIRLEPLNSDDHKIGLITAINDGELWNLFFTLVPTPDGLDEFFARAEMAAAAEDGLAYAIVENATGQIVGSTRFMKANWPNKRIEIGYTFLGKRWQKSLINTEAKFLMLTHGFDVLGLNRVEFITDFLNENSRWAILRLGAKQEGILRNHMVMPDGRVRDSVLYSITHFEWPGIRQHLLFKLSTQIKGE